MNWLHILSWILNCRSTETVSLTVGTTSVNCCASDLEASGSFFAFRTYRRAVRQHMSHQSQLTRQVGTFVCQCSVQKRGQSRCIEQEVIWQKQLWVTQLLKRLSLQPWLLEQQRADQAKRLLSHFQLGGTRRPPLELLRHEYVAISASRDQQTASADLCAGSWWLDSRKQNSTIASAAYLSVSLPPALAPQSGRLEHWGRVTPCLPDCVYW